MAAVPLAIPQTFSQGMRVKELPLFIVHADLRERRAGGTHGHELIDGFAQSKVGGQGRRGQREVGERRADRLCRVGGRKRERI